tara:strand:- start:109 stop:411 length:303 start_codon:yes stop_codon:yes gene_type:complete
MEKTRYEQVMDVLGEKGYDLSETSHDGRTSVEWDSRTSSYRIDFDEEGDVRCAEIDVKRVTVPTFKKFRFEDSWGVSPGGFYASDRFRLLEGILGIDLFK